MYYNTETSKRMFKMNPDCSQSTFRDSARQALQASKHQDGSLHMSTPFHDMQSKKVANMKQKLMQLNSMHGSSIRCPSNLNDSSAASITAATSYLPTQYDQNAKYGYRQRPISSTSYMLESSCQHNDNHDNQLGRSNTFVTDLYNNNKDSNHQSLNDHSPLRVSKLAPHDSKGAIRGKNNRLGADYMKVGAHSVIQDARKRHNMSSIINGYSPINQRPNQGTRNNECLKNNKARNSSNSGERNPSGNIYQSASFYKGGSVQSNRTNQSSPERLVNIVCPPSKGPKNRVEGKRIISTATRPRSDMRHQINNSFMGSEKLKKGFKNMKALGSSFGISASSQSNLVQSKRQKAAQKKMVTPNKIQRSQSSISYTKSKSKSHSRMRGGSRSRCSQRSTPNHLSANQSAKKQLQLNRRIVSSNQQHVTRIRRSASKNSNYSRSMPSEKDLSNNSNMKQQQSLIWQQRSSDCMNRDERRVNKYLKNQTNSSSVQKSFNFTSIEPDLGQPKYKNQQNHASKTFQNATNGQRSGQITGKFRSLNEHAMTQVVKSAQKSLVKDNQLVDRASKIQNVGFDDYDRNIVYKEKDGIMKNANLRTEDDYCETLTASSEDSPMRPSQRVQRAAALTTKAYLEDVNQRVENAKNHANSVREFGPRKMKVAYQGINQRQEARLQAMKQQMQESLIETHELQSKLQSSACDTKQARKGGVSQFNSLVLEFSQSLENKAIDLIQATESKRKNQKMKGMIAELQEIRRVRSRSKSMPVSARKRRHSSLSNSNRKSGKKLNSSRSNRSRSRNCSLQKASLRSRSNSKSKKGRKLGSQKSSRSGRSGKKLRLKSRSKSKSVRKLKSKKSQRSMSKSAKSVRSGRSIKSGRSMKSAKSCRSGKSGKSASSRGRSRSIKKKIKSVKRNIFKQTNGFTEISQVTLGQVKSRSRMSLSKNNSKSRSKSMKKGGRLISNGRSQSRGVSAKSLNRVQELGRKCSKLMTNKVNGTNKAQSTLIRRSLSKKKSRTTKVSKSRSKSTKRNMLNKRTPSRSKSRSKSNKRKMVRKKSLSRSKSARKSRRGSKSPNATNSQVKWEFDVTPKITPQITPQITPCMTPLHKILRNSMGENEMSELRGLNNRHGSNSQVKKVKIQSQRLRDITQLTSSDDSDSSYDSEDSLDNNRYLKRQQAHLSPWQRACIRKQLPKKFR